MASALLAVKESAIGFGDAFAVARYPSLLKCPIVFRGGKREVGRGEREIIKTPRYFEGKQKHPCQIIHMYTPFRLLLRMYAWPLERILVGIDILERRISCLIQLLAACRLP